MTGCETPNSGKHMYITRRGMKGMHQMLCTVMSSLEHVRAWTTG